MTKNVKNVSIGNSFFRAPEREVRNSFSQSVRNIDRYPTAGKTIGELNPELEALEI